MSTLILMRHAQASFGAAHYDKLSAHGEAQARASRDWVAARASRFARLVIGPRDRHRETARLATEGLPVPPIEMDPHFDESCDAGSLLRAAELRIGKPLGPDSGVGPQELLRHFGDQVLVWADDTQRMEGVVPIDEYRARVAAVLDRYMDPSKPEQTILAVTSGGFIGVAFGIVYGLTNHRIGQMIGDFSVENCSLTAFYDAAHGREIRFFNQTSHLAPELTTSA